MYAFGQGSLQFSSSKFDKDDSNKKENNRNNDSRGNKQNRQNQKGNKPKSNNFGSMNISGIMKRLSPDSEFGTTKRQDTRKDKVADNANQAIVDQATLDDFVEEYAKNKSDGNVIADLLRAQIVDIAKIMENYYNNAYAEIADSMTNVMKLMTTKTFAVNLIALVKNHDEVFDDWEDSRLYIGDLISLALETHHNKMIDETKSIYVEIITDYIWNFEIKDIATRFRLTEDAATDLVIGIPNFGRDMTDTQIRHQYDNFLNMLINHGGCAIDYLNREHQRELFYYLFKDENRVAIKAAGQCLGDELLVFEEEEDEALYNEYVNMLYDVVNEHDLEDIRVVLRYIVKVRANLSDEKKDTTTVFDVAKAIEYDNIKKAIVDYCEHSEAARKFLS